MASPSEDNAPTVKNQRESTALEVEIQRAISSIIPSQRRWLYYHRFLIITSFFGPTIVTISWIYVLSQSPWSMDEASISRVLQDAQPGAFRLLLISAIINSIAFLILVSSRNIQCQVIFVTEKIGCDWSFVWRHMNWICVYSSYIGVISMTLVIAFDVGSYPGLHLLFACIMTVCLMLFESFHALLTLRHRLHQYQETRQWKNAAFFIDGLYFAVICVATAVCTIWYLKTATQGDLSGDEPALEAGYWAEWMLYFFIIWYFLMLSLTLHLDSCNDEIQIFVEQSYYFVIGARNWSFKEKKDRNKTNVKEIEAPPSKVVTIQEEEKGSNGGTDPTEEQVTD